MPNPLLDPWAWLDLRRFSIRVLSRKIVELERRLAEKCSCSHNR